MDAIISSNIDPNHTVQPESDEIQNKAKQEQEEQSSRKRDLLAALLLPEARQRLSRIALVSPERSKSIEDALLQRAGSLRRRVTESDFIKFLNEMEGVEEKASEKPTIMYRRKGFDDFEL